MNQHYFSRMVHFWEVRGVRVKQIDVYRYLLICSTVKAYKLIAGKLAEMCEIVL